MRTVKINIHDDYLFKFTEEDGCYFYFERNLKSVSYTFKFNLKFKNAKIYTKKNRPVFVNIDENMICDKFVKDFNIVFFKNIEAFAQFIIDFFENKNQEELFIEY